MIRLCSSSPTRAKLLEKFGIDFLQSAVSFDEDSVVANNPKSFVYSVARGKLDSALSIYNLETPILVADTVVAKGNQILRKAKDKDDAKRLLLEQSGSNISIITATILKSNTIEFIDISTTIYNFSKFDSTDLDKYLNSAEWQGKAGACMVEGFCKKYINSVDGLESNAMGLPVEKIAPWIEL